MRRAARLRNRGRHARYPYERHSPRNEVELSAKIKTRRLVVGNASIHRACRRPSRRAGRCGRIQRPALLEPRGFRSGGDRYDDNRTGRRNCSRDPRAAGADPALLRILAVELVWDAVAIVRPAQHDDGHLAGSSAERWWDHGVAQADTYLIPPHGEGR